METLVMVVVVVLAAGLVFQTVVTGLDAYEEAKRDGAVRRKKY